MKTKLLKPIWLAALLLLSVITASAYDFKVDGIAYNYNDDGTTVTVTYTAYQTSYNYGGLSTANIPSSVSYNGKTYSVTSIGNFAFYQCSGLTSVTIPNSVTSIGEFAFFNCNRLTSVHITDLAAWCNISFEPSANPLGRAHHLFLNGTEVKDLVVPNSVTSIGKYAFYNCTGLTSVTIPNSVTSIGDEAFEFCSGLTSVTIGNSVTSIGESAFSDCSSLTSVTIPNSVTSINAYMFRNCTGLTNVTIPNSVTSIYWYAFENCSSLTSVTIPNSVTSIDAYVFRNCTGLTNVTIPNSVTSIGWYAFENCSSLTTVNWNAKSCADCSSNSLPFNGLTRITSFNFGNEVEHIPAYLCYGLSGLTSVTIPNSVTSIGGSAFQGCSGLTTVNWNAKSCADCSSNSLPFNGLTGITSFNFGNEVEHIPAYLCYGLSGLTSVTIPNSVTSIGLCAFQLCSRLTSVHITDLAAWCNITFGDNLANPLFYAHHLFLNGAEVTDLVIPNSVTSIGDYAFFRCSGLTSITIPNSVTSIGQYAFSGCGGLTSIDIPNSVTSIGGGAFSGCSGLTSVTIPNPVTSIGQYAFSGCSGLESITVDSGNPSYDSRGNCNAIIETATNKLIAGCKNTVIPNSVTSIGDWAFVNCHGLTSVTIPNSVTSIGSGAFAFCSGLTSIYNYINHPTNVTLGSNVFDGVNKTNCTLFVTKGCVDEYRNADQWKDFVNIVEGNWATDISFENDFLTLYLGETDTLQVQLTPTSAPYPTLLWQSSDTTVATVDQNGMVTAIAVGTATISATTTTDYGLNLSASCTVYVRAHVSSISLDKDSTILYLNETDTLTATVLPEFAYNKVVNWSSSDANVATVDQNGVVTAHAVGTAIITATTTDGTSLSDSCLVEVRAYVAGISFDKTQTSIYVGGNDSIAATILPENAYNKTLLWQSSDSTIVTVDQNGKIAAVGLGNAIITANTTDCTNLSASCEVNVTGITSIALNKANTLLYLNETDSLSTNITPADVIIKDVMWTSSNPSVASVNQNGVVTALAVGNAMITATTTDGTNLSASCGVEVRAYVSSVTFDKTQIDTYVGATETITATVLPENAYNKGLIWQTSNLSVASVDQNGKVTAHALGSALIVAKTTDGTNLMATCEVNVTGITSLTLNVTDITLFAGSSQTLQTTIVPADVVVNTLLWQSSDPTVATVDQNGKVTALAAGTATITAATTDGTNLSASCTVTVWPQYALVAPGIEHTRGEQPLTVEYAIEMLNKNSISGMQFEIQFPDSVTLMNSSYGLPDMWLGDRARDHFIDVTELGYNHYQVLISSPTNKNFRNNSGDLVFMHLLVDQYHAAGIYNINVTNIIFTEADETEHAVADASYPVQYNYMLGDADANMQVNVADYITTALFITNRPTIRFYEDAANVHSANPAINVTDLTGIINIVLGIRPTEILHAPALGNASPAGNMEPEMNVGVKRLDADRWMMSLDLSNGQPMAAFQLDLKLPDGVTYESASVTDRTALLNVLDGTLPDGTTRLVVSAPSIDDIKAGNGEVLNITLKGNPAAGGMATFDNITLAERSLNSYELEPMTVPFTPTAIDDVITYNEVRIYPENGCIVIESPYAGTAQLVLLNGISSPLDVKAGRNSYPVGKNEYYIVRFGSTTAKLKF